VALAARSHQQGTPRVRKHCGAFRFQARCEQAFKARTPGTPFGAPKIILLLEIPNCKYAGHGRSRGAAPPALRGFKETSP
jgi:hypothetical protein